MIQRDATPRTLSLHLIPLRHQPLGLRHKLTESGLASSLRDVDGWHVLCATSASVQRGARTEGQRHSSQCYLRRRRPFQQDGARCPTARDNPNQLSRVRRAVRVASPVVCLCAVRHRRISTQSIIRWTSSWARKHTLASRNPLRLRSVLVASPIWTCGPVEDWSDPTVATQRAQPGLNTADTFDLPPLSAERLLLLAC